MYWPLAAALDCCGVGRTAGLLIPANVTWPISSSSVVPKVDAQYIDQGKGELAAVINAVRTLGEPEQTVPGFAIAAAVAPNKGSSA